MLSTHTSPGQRTWRLVMAACVALLASAVLAVRPPAVGAHTVSPIPTATVSRLDPPSLIRAARRSTQADRNLVADAKAMKRCMSRHPTRCASERRAVQQAGDDLAKAKRHLATVARSNRKRDSRRGRSSVLRAPLLSVSGQTLTWTRLDHVSIYVIEAKAPDQAAQYMVVNGTSVTPPPVPGVTVSYRVRTSVKNSSWSAEQSISYALPSKPTGQPPTGSISPPAEEAGTPPAGTVDTQAAPALTLSGQTLTWNQVGNVSTYVLMERLAGQAERFSAVSGTSFIPTPLPGETVYYSVRTAVDGSAWAREVAITFPAVKSETPVGSEPISEQPSGPPTESPSTPPTEKSPGTETEGGSPGSFEMGLVPATLANTEPSIIKDLGAHSVRMEAVIGSSPSTMGRWFEEYAQAGIRIMPLAGFESTIPTSAQAKSLATWAAAFGPGGTFWKGKSEPAGTAMTTIEFGNETSYTYQWSDNSPSAVASRAQEYAIRFKEAYEAIHAANPNVGLLAQADDGDTGNSIWVENMFKAVPNLGQMVAGWTVHPYGPEWQTRIDALISQTQASGASSSIPIYVTEWGLASDGGRCLSDNYDWNKCMTYSEAATILGSTVSEMRARYGSRLRAFYLYQAQDLSESGTSTDRDEYFGALQYDGAPKGAYTSEVKSLLSLYG